MKNVSIAALALLLTAHLASAQVSAQIFFDPDYFGDAAYRAPVASASALPACASGGDEENSLRFAIAENELYYCPAGGGAWAVIVSSPRDDSVTLTKLAACSGPNEIVEYDASGDPSCITTPSGGGGGGGSILTTTNLDDNELVIWDSGTSKLVESGGLSLSPTAGFQVPSTINGHTFDIFTSSTGAVTMTTETGEWSVGAADSTYFPITLSGNELQFDLDEDSAFEVVWGSTSLTLASGFTIDGVDISTLPTSDTTCLDAGVNCTFAGSSSEGGAATTALALDSDPTACSAGQYVSDISASGVLTCSTPAGGGDQLGDDADRGDITISSSGTVATIDAGAVTDAKVSDDITLDISGAGSVTGGTSSRCARFDGSGDLVAASSDCDSLQPAPVIDEADDDGVDQYLTEVATDRDTTADDPVRISGGQVMLDVSALSGCGPSRILPPSTTTGGAMYWDADGFGCCVYNDGTSTWQPMNSGGVCGGGMDLAYRLNNNMNNSGSLGVTYNLTTGGSPTYSTTRTEGTHSLISVPANFTRGFYQMPVSGETYSTASWSMGVWINATSFSSGADYRLVSNLADNSLYSNAGGQWLEIKYVSASTATLECGMYSDASTQVTATSAAGAVASATATHLACVYDGVELQAYVDGAVSGTPTSVTSSYPPTVSSGQEFIRVGAGPDLTIIDERPLDGTLDDAWIDFRPTADALTDAQVCQVASCGTGHPAVSECVCSGSSYSDSGNNSALGCTLPDCDAVF